MGGHSRGGGGGLFEGAYQIIVDIKKTLIKTSSILVVISL